MRSLCGSAARALPQRLRTISTDVLFLDVHMLLVADIELLQLLPRLPQWLPATVLVTSSPKYAPQAFAYAEAAILPV